MQTRLRVAVHGEGITDEIRSKIEDKFSKLDHYFSRITGCTVTVNVVKAGRKHGQLFELHVDVTVPKGNLVVDRHRAESLYVAIREAFNAARRKLQEHARLLRGQIKDHEEPPLGRIVELERAKGFGFIRTSDGREIYFHRNSVLDDGFEKLEVGTPVFFAEEEGDKGPQASTVRIAKRIKPRSVPRV